MPLVYKQWTGTIAQAAVGIPLTNFDGGWCIPEFFDIIGGISGVNISDAALTLITHPGAEVDIGSDINGNLGTLLSFTNLGNYLDYNTSNGNVNFPNGFFQESIRLEVNFVDLDAIANITVVLSPGFPLDQYTEDPLFLPPFGVTANDGIEHFIDLGWSSQYLLQEETGFEVQKSVDGGDTWETMALEPRTADVDYEITLPFEDNVIYRVRGYRTSDTTFSPWSSETLEAEDDPPGDLLHIPTGGIKLGTISVGEINVAGPIEFVFNTDPSGIYTIVPNQKFDRLYNRAGDAFVDVAIPNPFVKTGYIP